MINLILTPALGVLLFTAVSSAQVLFNYVGQAPVEVSRAESDEISKTVKASERGFRVSPEALDRLSPELKQKLDVLNAQDLYYRQNDEYAMFMQYMGIREKEALQLRHDFVHETAKEIINRLKADPNALFRVMARDLNEVYSQVEYLLSVGDSEMGLTLAQKYDFAKRIALVPASRPIVDSILKGPAAQQEIMALFQITSSTMAEKNVVILDSGYEGSIAIKLKSIFQQGVESGRIAWNFIWKAPNAPDFVNQFRIPQFESYLKGKGLLEKFYMADKVYSFRVALLEHFPKWTGRSLGWNSEPVVIMLDLDDTVLKEVDIKNNRFNEKVQTLKYIPDARVALKYKERLSSPVQDPKKVVHFEFHGDQLHSAVTVRPAMASFLKSLFPLMQIGKVKILVTSNNDFARTQSAFEQLKIAGLTLKEMGAVVVDPKKFNDANFRKDMGLLRKNLSLKNESTVIAIDDLPENYVRSSDQDQVEGVKAFAGSYVQDVLEGKVNEDSVQDRLQLSRLHEAILKAAILTEPETQIQKVRSAYFERKQRTFQPSLGALAAPMCRTLVSKVGP